MKSTIYALITISVILMIALLYATTKLQNTEMRRQSSAAKAEAMKRENQQLKLRLESRQSGQLLLSAQAVPDGVQAIFDEHEQTISDLEARLAAATAENESLRKQMGGKEAALSSAWGGT